WDLKSSKVTVTRVPGEDSHAARALEKRIEIDGDLDAAQRARLKEIAGRCPVHRMLAEPVRIDAPED
ncbi:MAG: osmotically inducible protein C, partial [Pseudomonadota bacterium]